MKTQKFLPYIIGAAFASSIFGFFSFKDRLGSDPVIVEDSRLTYKWFAPKTPQSMSLFEEKMPLQKWEVRERLDRELLFNNYMHGSTLYILKLTGRYLPTIERILKEQNVPDDFKYLCIAESALRNQTSPAGAEGYWQFLSETGRRYGLEINSEVDERYDLEKSTRAACKYLRDAYNKFGNWTAAAASYNCGMGGYSNYSSYQNTDYYYDLLLPEETNRYIYRIAALKLLVGYSSKFGFMVSGDDMYQPIPTRKVPVTSSISNLASFASSQGTTYKMVKLLNPWLQGKSLTAKSGKTYMIELPVN